MSGDRTLIAYITKGGVTEEAAAVISSVLRDKYGLVVDVVNLRENSSPDLVQYANVIIGSGVRMQKVYKEALKFLQNDFGDRRVAIFLSSGEAGDPKSYDQAITKYVKNVLAKYPHVRPVAAEAFGGRMAILGKTVSDSRNMEKVRVWAEELGKKLSD
jgi:menaquinone-dependent protoporphyrinogen IX oxidase